MELLKELEKIPYTVTIHKFSPTTYIKDSKELNNFLYKHDENNSDSTLKTPVWRCRIGQSGKWYFAFTVEKATSEALKHYQAINKNKLKEYYKKKLKELEELEEEI